MTFTTDWRNLYGETWKGIITPAAFAHPAKFSRGLIRKIYTHAIAQGWVKEGDRVLDPFGGTGLGGYDAARMGLHWTGIELEKRFFILGQGMDCPGVSSAFWRRYHRRGSKWLALGVCPDCGDLLDTNPPAHVLFGVREKSIPIRAAHRYKGNLGTWGELFPNFPGSARLINGDSRRLLSLLAEAEPVDLAISSPPFGEAQSGGGIAVKGYRNPTQRPSTADQPFDLVGERSYTPETQGTADGQLANMAMKGFDLAVGSPPYEGTRIDGNGDEGSSGLRGENGEYLRGAEGWKVRKEMGGRYGETEGQLGGMADDFWLAARAIVDQVFASLKPGGVSIWVVKDFVRNKQVEPFCEKWRLLCEAAGFETVCQHRAWLVEEAGNARALFDFSDGEGNLVPAGTVVRLEDGKVKKPTKERKGFFKRLAEKNGSPRIDWEMVICMRKTTGGQPVHLLHEESNNA